MGLSENNRLQAEAFKATDLPLELILVAGSVISSYKDLCSAHNYGDTCRCIVDIKYHI